MGVELRELGLGLGRELGEGHGGGIIVSRRRLEGGQGRVEVVGWAKGRAEEALEERVGEVG